MYTENSRESTDKLLGLIRAFSNFTGYKLNIQKLIGLMYTKRNQLKCFLNGSDNKNTIFKDMHNINVMT